MWHARGAHQRTWFFFMEFIREKCRINQLTLAMAGDFRYGGSAAQKQDAAEDEKFEGYVANVSAAQSTNQNTMQLLVAQNNIQAGQITQL